MKKDPKRRGDCKYLVPLFLLGCGDVETARIKEEGWDYLPVARCLDDTSNDFVIDQYDTLVNDYPGTAQHFQLVARRQVASDIRQSGIRGNKPSSREDELIIDGLVTSPVANDPTGNHVTYHPTQVASLQGEYHVHIHFGTGFGVLEMHDPDTDRWLTFGVSRCKRI